MVSIYASSTILGNIVIGELNAAGSLVLKDVEANISRVAGIPATEYYFNILKLASAATVEFSHLLRYF